MAFCGGYHYELGGRRLVRWLALPGDAQVTPAEYQEKAKEFDFWAENYLFFSKTDTGLETELSGLLHGALGAAGEAGELAGLVKKALGDQDYPVRAEVLSECGDVLWYISLALSACGLSLQAAMEANIAKLSRRREKGKDKVAERELFEIYAARR